MTRTLIAVLLATVALSLSAQPYLREFGNGPAKWLMTSEEQRAWRNVKTDDEALDFADLFWARRDPTPGTGRNEFRLDYENRVAYADANFKEGKKRGALTERGRVLVLLGFPTELLSHGDSNTGRTGGSEAIGQKTSASDAAGDPTGGRTLAAKDEWNYSHAAAVKFNVPKIQVVFIHDGYDNAAHRDPQRTDFTMALPGAIKSYIVSPSLTTVPDWASSRGVVSRAAVPTEHTETVSTETVTKKTVIVDAPRPVAKPAGVGRFILLNDSTEMRPQSGSDPFAPFTAVAQFKKDREMGWAAEYCSGTISADVTALKVQLKILAPSGDTFSTDPEEFEPDSIKADPGCYLLRGALPLSDFETGAYKVTLTISSPAGAESYNLTREFRVE